MCGILGNFGYIEREEFLTHVENSSHLLSRRGPDQRNIINVENFLAVHSRLIVQGNDDDGVQPFRFKNLVLLYNGNLYNKDLLKKKLISKGHHFVGISDTEVVALSIAEWGNKAFEKFNGFYALAYIDLGNKKLTLARDKLGQKPLYYARNTESVFFGSTETLVPKKHCGNIRNESYVDFITYGFVPSPNTMFRNLFSVKPGSYISFSYRNEKISVTEETRYWQPNITNKVNDINQATELIAEAISESMEDGLNASIDVACLYSGGVDSSLIFSNARTINDGICAITADFGLHDDAKLRSQDLVKSLKHKNHVIKNISQAEVTTSLDRTNRICDSPFDDTSIIPSNIVFSTVKEAGYSVALTGDGADELFCGYSSFQRLSKMEKLLSQKYDVVRSISKGIFGCIASFYNGADLARVFMNEKELLVDLSCNGFKKREWADSIESEYDPFHHVRAILDEVDDLDTISKYRILNLTFKLPNQMLYKVDRASMFNSVEARPLFLNDNIVETALNISSKVMLKQGTKSILKNIYQRQLPTPGWKLPKTGFGWKTESYQHIFNQNDRAYVKKKTNIDGFELLKKRKMNRKRGFYGLFSLAAWLKANS